MSNKQQLEEQIKGFVTDCLNENYPSVKTITEGIMLILTNQATDKPKEEELSQPQTSMRWVKELGAILEALVYYSQIHTVRGVRPAGMFSHEEAWKKGQEWLWKYCKHNGLNYEVSESQEELTSPQKGDKEIEELAEKIWNKHFKDWTMAGQVKREGLKAMVEIYKAAK